MIVIRMLISVNRFFPSVVGLPMGIGESNGERGKRHRLRIGPHTPYFSAMTTAIPTTEKEAKRSKLTICRPAHPDPSFRRLIENRHAGFLGGSPSSHFELDIDLREPSESAADDEREVTIQAGEWLLKRGNFRTR